VHFSLFNPFLFTVLFRVSTRAFSMQNTWRAFSRSNDGLIDQLKDYQIISSDRVEKAMRAVDRGKYSADQSLAYFDQPHPIGHGQTISAPHMHAFCLEKLENKLKDGANALDVGSGSGYLTAAMARMVAPKGKVLGIEIVPELVEFAKNNLKEDQPQLLKDGVITVKSGNGWEELKGHEFDAIHVGAAAVSVPEALIKLLKPGGRMLIPIGPPGGDQALYQLDKDEKGKVATEKLLGVRYVPLVKGSTKKSEL